MFVTQEVSKLSGWLKTDALLNMPVMFVTLEVSTLSGWLNAFAPCRESKEGHAVRGEVYGSGGSRWWTTAAARSVQGRARLQIGSRARGEERT